MSTTVFETFDFDEKQRSFVGSGFMLTFVIQNTGAKDYTLPQNLRLFKRSDKTGALEEVNMKLDHAFIVPAKDSAQFNASVEYGCSDEDTETGKVTERDGVKCFNDAFGNVTEFVGFDDNTHTRLNLPKPVFYAGTKTESKGAANGMAPDRGQPWEKYGACSQAYKLVPICKKRGISLDAAKDAADGWTPVGPLPTLPVPPHGFTLQPDEAVCRAVYEWDYYCRQQGMGK